MAAPKKGKGKPKKPRTRRQPTKKVGKRAKPKTKKQPKKKKSTRKGPTISATLVNIGTVCYGNDGQLWRVVPTTKSQKWAPAKMQARPGMERKFRSGPCASKVHKPKN